MAGRNTMRRVAASMQREALLADVRGNKACFICRQKVGQWHKKRMGQANIWSTSAFEKIRNTLHQQATAIIRGA